MFYAPQTWAPAASSVIFGIAAVTDWLDGYLARRWKVTSAFGAFLDPVADKLIVGAALVLLPTSPALSGLQAALLAIPAVIITLREIFISALREWMATSGQRSTVKVGWTGKCKTAAQMVSITCLLAFYRDGLSSYAFRMAVALLHVSTVLAVLSALEYFRAAWPTLQDRSQVR